MFRVFGHDKIWVLDGGMPRWHASGFEVESSASSGAASNALLQASAAIEAIERAYRGQPVSHVISVKICFMICYYTGCRNSVPLCSNNYSN